MYTQKNADLKLTMVNAHNEFEMELKKYALFKVGDNILCDDLVQEAYMKTWKYMVSSGKIHLMKPFLYRILNCLIIDEYRKRKTISLDELIENGLELGVDSSTKMINQLDGASAIKMIELLPISYKSIVYMRYVEELSVGEVSILTGQSKNMITVKTHRGLEKLRSLYTKQ